MTAEQGSSPARVAVYGQTDVGLVREHNEDAFLALDLASGERWTERGVSRWEVKGAGVLLAVSDGLGGHAAGEVASALTLQALVEGLAGAEGDDGQGVIRAVQQANARVREAGHAPDHEGMAATLTLVLLRPDAVYVAEVGDSRAYLLRQGQLCQVTHDQSFVQVMVDQGLMTQEQAERSPQKNVVLQVMGQSRDLNVALGRLTLQSGDRLVLCSDGLSNELSSDEIHRLGSDQAGVDRACQELVAAALRHGGYDNVTVLVAEVDGPAAGSAPTVGPCEAVETLQEFDPTRRDR